MKGIVPDILSRDKEAGILGVLYRRAPVLAGLTILGYISVLIARDPVRTSLYVCAAIIGLGLLLNPFSGLPIIFFLGMIGDFQHFSGGLSLVKPIIVLVMLGFVPKYLTRQIQLRRTGIELPLALFFIIYCLGLFFTIGTNQDLGPLITLIGYPVAFLLVLNLTRTIRQIEWLIGASLIGAVIAALLADINLFVGYNPLSLIRDISDIPVASGPFQLHRISGVLADPNGGAFMHILGLPVLISLLISSKGWLSRMVLSISALTVGIALMATFSRSGYIGAVFALIWLFFLVDAGKRAGILVVVALLMSILTTFIPSAALVERFYQIHEEFGGESDRSLYYRTAFDLLREHPLVPAGEDAFMFAIAQKTGIAQGPHSNILSVGINAGVLGLGSFIWLVYSYTRLVLRGLRSMQPSALRGYALGVYAGLMGLQVQGLFVDNLSWFLMWAIAAIPLCCIWADRATTIWRASNTSHVICTGTMD